MVNTSAPPHQHLLSGWLDEQSQRTISPAALSRPVPSRSDPSHPPSDAWPGPPAKALLAGQTLRLAEHKGWVNSSSLGPLSPPAEAEGGSLISINSSQQQSDNAQLRCTICRNVPSDNEEELKGRMERSLFQEMSEKRQNEHSRTETNK